MREKTAPRELGLDLIRAAAGVLVLSVHFFMNSGFYDAPVSGRLMLAACMVRVLCMTCVPLFLLLTGYTCVRRAWSPEYYRKLVPVLLTYLLAGGVCMAYQGLILHQSLSLRGVIRAYLDFTAAPYGWYIHMYIGLFLLSPFFNAAWKHLDKRARGALLVTLVFLSILPGSANRWGYVLPYWWVDIYPLAYYAAGAWLREYPLKIGGGKLLALCGALAALMGAFGYLAAGGGVYLWQPEDNWNSWPLMLQAVALFSCLSRVRSAPRPVAWAIGRVAKLSLGMYLVSWVADQIVYPRLIAAVPAVHLRILWMPLTVLAAVLLSLILAQVVEWARAGLSRGINKICPKAELR